MFVHHIHEHDDAPMVSLAHRDFQPIKAYKASAGRQYRQGALVHGARLLYAFHAGFDTFMQGM